MTDRLDVTDGLDELVTAAVRAWATVARAWLGAFNAIGVSWLDLPGVESGRTGFNQETVVVEAQGAPTDLHPGPFADWDGNELPPAVVTVVPPQVVVGQEAEVCIQVKPSLAIASGTYTGSLWDSSGDTCLVDEIGIYVVGGPAP
jgi:hypothetical protein